MGVTVQEDSRNSGSARQSTPTVNKHEPLPTITPNVRYAQLLVEFVRNPFAALLLPENELESSPFLKGLKNVQLPDEITEKYASLTKEQAIEAVVENLFVYFALPKELINDPKFCLAAIEAGAEIYLFLPREIQVQSKIVSVESAKNGFCVRSLGGELLEDVGSMKKILEVIPALYADLPLELRSNKEIIFQILDRAPGLVNAIPKEL